MGYWIIEKLYTLWFVLGFFFPLFWNAFFGFPLLVARSLPNLRWLIVYIIVIGILLYDWNQEVYKIPGEQYEDFQSLSLAIAEMFTLPFNLIEKMQWWAIPVTAIVSFILLGLEEVGKELENPFLYGVNDLPVDDLCQNIIADIEIIASFASEDSISLKQDEYVAT